MGLFSSDFVGNLTSSSWSPWKGMLQWNRIEIFCVCEVDNHKKKSIKYSGKDYCDFLYVVVTINNHPRWKLTYGRSLVRWLKTPACYSHTTRWDRAGSFGLHFVPFYPFFPQQAQTGAPVVMISIITRDRSHLHTRQRSVMDSTRGREKVELRRHVRDEHSESAED